MRGASFKKCYIDLGQFKKYPYLDFSDCHAEPLTTEIFSQQLLAVVETLRNNDFIRHSMVLVIKNKKVAQGMGSTKSARPATQSKKARQDVGLFYAYSFRLS